MGYREGKGFLYLDRSQGDEPLPVWISDQGADFPAKNVCRDLDLVLGTARRFYESGEPDPELAWEGT